MQALAMELSPMLTDFSNDIMLNERLFERVKSVYDQAVANDFHGLVTEQRTLLTDTYEGFVRSGANLTPEQKEEYRALTGELSQQTLRFEQNVLAATNDFQLQLKSEVNAADEAFAGITAESAVEVSADNANFTVNIELKRVVAGVLAYFTRIPYEISYNGTMTKVTHVKVQVVTRGTAVNLKDRSAVTTATGENYYDLIDLDLTTSSKDGDNNWYKTQTTADGLGTGVTVVDNSWISGKYTMPLLIGEQETTMQVILTDGTNTLKKYPVVDNTTSSKKFDLMANHLYQLGGKPEAGDTGAGGEDPDPDKPVDLTTSQTINIIVNAEWDSKHDLILGE